MDDYAEVMRIMTEIDEIEARVAALEQAQARKRRILDSARRASRRLYVVAIGPIREHAADRRN